MESESLTADDIWAALDAYFSEPDVTGCFTLYDLMERYGWGRNKAKIRMDRAIDEGRAEFVGSGDKGKGYYRWIVGNAG